MSSYMRPAVAVLGIRLGARHRRRDGRRISVDAYTAALGLSSTADDLAQGSNRDLFHGHLPEPAERPGRTIDEPGSQTHAVVAT